MILYSIPYGEAGCSGTPSWTLWLGSAFSEPQALINFISIKTLECVTHMQRNNSACVSCVP
ncbi:MAG: hypothetical protein GFH27_549285n364 [Chloroflexi bacterium AL-W]|nr:hypothetical protein [Chloroflexi bacterium AL-N1]NOK65875.1 hypothetical protein [Chloroflexi bacterium AL-N10]NOK74184.1 hypothetical protein [Chloroflexi bacterium AL-N5]NOK80908.1 hypothetical protein [Chloroflexi bacterium AL-W]NOK88442.1 hypothetical protein [Chloroflexi bacterium AL-N15]